MRTAVNAMVNFGVEKYPVIFPVGVASAVKSTSDHTFTKLHKKCQTPVKLKTVGGSPAQSLLMCEKCETETDEIVRGYEYAKGKYVIVLDEEIEAVSPERSPMIQLRKFVKRADIIPSMIARHYFLTPDKLMGEPYGLLYQALAETKLAGIGTQTLWGKEHPCAVMAVQDFDSGGVLMMATLQIADDLVKPDFAAPIPNREAKRLAKELILATEGVFDPVKDLVSVSHNNMQALISAKIEGRKIPTGESTKEPEVTQDIIATLKESIDAAAKKPVRAKATTGRKR
jgi:DNA end-binding protein Ku